MKKFLIAFNVCLVSILFFLTYTFFESSNHIATFRRFSSPTYKLSKSVIDMIHQNNNIDDDTIETQVIKSILHIIEYHKWNDFLDYITMDIYYANLTNSSSKQLIVSLNLSKDHGVAVIFDEVEDSYIYRSKIDNLAPIENIKSINHPTEKQNFIAIYQTVDESLGAFFRENFVQIYKYSDPNFYLVWEKTLFYEEVFNENWVNVESPNTYWTMVIEETEIDFNFTDSIKINTITSLKKYKAQSKNTPKKDDFILNEEKSYTRPYYWSDEYNSFVLGELTKDVFISDVAVLSDMENSQEWLFGIQNLYYKVSTQNGDIIYLPKSKFRKLVENTYKN